MCGKVVGLDELYPLCVYGGELGCGVLRNFFCVLWWNVEVEWLLGYLERFGGRFLGLFYLRLGV